MEAAFTDGSKAVIVAVVRCVGIHSITHDTNRSHGQFL